MNKSKLNNQVDFGYTLQDLRRGRKNDDLKKLSDFPSEVLSHSAKRKNAYICI